MVNAVPETLYAPCGDLSLAYQVFGDGPVELVCGGSFASHIELYCTVPGFVAFFERGGCRSDIEGTWPWPQDRRSRPGGRCLPLNSKSEYVGEDRRISRHGAHGVVSGACTTKSSASHCFLPSVCVSQASAANYAANRARRQNGKCPLSWRIVAADRQIDAYCSSNRHEGIDMATLIVAAATFSVLVVCPPTRRMCSRPPRTSHGNRQATTTLF
jgi:hypothetical protein